MGNKLFVVVVGLLMCGCAAQIERPRCVNRANVVASIEAPEGMPTPPPGQFVIGGPAVFATTPVVVKDTRTMRNAPDVFNRPKQEERAVKSILPLHESPDRQARVGPPPSNDSLQGQTLDAERAAIDTLIPGPSRTEWRPPDPNIAVGPNHIVATVNMAFAIYDKATGTQLFANSLNNYGDPGLFESIGSAWFVFDPRCFYDHFAQRFVILGLETYADPFGSWVNIAVSDDSDPQGIWYTYRTPANTGTAWWDYPGFGYDDKAWVVTSNLIGGGGSGIRIFDKQSMLSGGPARFFTLTNSEFTIQVAQHMGAPRASDAPIYMIATGVTNTQSLLAFQNALTAPTIARADVVVPSKPSPQSIPTPTDTIGNLVDLRVQTAAWRDGRLVATLTVGGGTGAAAGSRARWYDIATNNWPNGGTPALTQVGDVGPGAGVHAFFPAVHINADGALGMVMNLSSASMNPSVAVAARSASDPLNAFGSVQVVKTGEIGEGGRWGDYSGIAIDPVDDRTFWSIAEYKTREGWANWITSFTVPAPTQPTAVPDTLGERECGVTIDVDVLANDQTLGAIATILSFDATSEQGGTVASVVSPQGRTALRYVAPLSVSASRVTDRFAYTLQTAAGTSSASVSVALWDAAYFVPATTLQAGAVNGLVADYYDVGDATSFPNFASLSPFSSFAFGSPLNFSWGLGNLIGQRSDGVGIVFRGTFIAPVSGLYRFALTANEGAKLWLGGRLVNDNSGPNSSELEREAFIGLQAGAHDLRVEYYERWERAGILLVFRSGALGGFVGGANTRQQRVCDAIDFNRNGLYPEDQDLLDLLSVLAGGSCSTQASGGCNDIDFNNDGLFPSDDDLLAFLRVLAGGGC